MHNAHDLYGFFNNEQYAIEETDDLMIILEMQSQTVFLLNSTSKEIFNGLIQQQSIGNIVQNYLVEHKITDDIVMHNNIFQDFSQIRSTLLERGILYEQ